MGRVQFDTVSGARLPARDLSESQAQRVETPGTFILIPPYLCFGRAAPGTGALHRFRQSPRYSVPLHPMGLFTEIFLL
jgi:hypothetical protein